jgi:hypothetical protein
MVILFTLSDYMMRVDESHMNKRHMWCLIGMCKKSARDTCTPNFDNVAKVVIAVCELVLLQLDIIKLTSIIILQRCNLMFHPCTHVFKKKAHVTSCVW